MSIVLPLTVYPAPPMPPEMLLALKTAKNELCARDNLDFSVQISPAVPGCPTRVLSFVGPTPFIADVAMLRNWRDPEELRYWLEWVLDEEQPVEKGFTKAQWMALHLPGAVEVPGPHPAPITDDLYATLPY
jgi:hypothetical protein